MAVEITLMDKLETIASIKESFEICKKQDLNSGYQPLIEDLLQLFGMKLPEGKTVHVSGY